MVDGLQALIANPEVEDSELFTLIPAPDFPTGGIVMGTDGARDMYSTGRGSVLLRAAAHVESGVRGTSKEAVVVTELPYGVAKNSLLEKIANMVNEKKLTGITDIRDESTMKGVRASQTHRTTPPLCSSAVHPLHGAPALGAHLPSARASLACPSHPPGAPLLAIHSCGSSSRSSEMPSRSSYSTTCTSARRCRRRSRAT